MAAGNVCTMLSSAQVARLHAPPTCTPKSSKGVGNTTSTGFWLPTAPGGARLTVTVVEWTNAKQFAAAQKQVKALPGEVQPVKGIGTAAYESAVGNQIVVNFVRGRTIVNMLLQSPPKTLAGTAAFNAAAKAIAAKL
jgi:hypothetical protein